MTTPYLAPNCSWISLGPLGYLGVCNGPPIPPPPAPDLPEIDLPDLPPLTGPGRAEATTPGARVQDRALERTRDDVCTSGCSDCIAAAGGFPRWVSYHNNRDKPINPKHVRGYAYQAYVSSLPHEPENGRNMVWQWAAYDWDGIEIPTCTMLEAKYGYDDYFVPYDPSGPTALPGKGKFIGIVFGKLTKQLGDQILRIEFTKGAVRLRWVFSHQNPMNYLMVLANASELFDYTTEYLPFDGGPQE